MLHRHDRIFPLSKLNSYPGSDCLDMTFLLPPDEDRRRRVWLMTPKDSPVVAVDLVSAEPQHVHDGPPRWVDYGVMELPLGFTQLRISDLHPTHDPQSHLVVTKKLDYSCSGKNLETVERELWGMSRAEAGRTMLTPSMIATGSAATFTARYEAGPAGLPQGGLVRFAVPKAFAAPQKDDPAADGFVSVDDPAVEITYIGASNETHEKIDIICRLQKALAPGQSFQISYRTSRTYLYASEFVETERQYWWSRLAPLSAAAAVSADLPFVSLAEENGHTLKIMPGPAERLHLRLPGRRYADEKLVLAGVFTDRFRNVAPLGTIDADFELWLISGDQKEPLGAAAKHFTARYRFELPLPELKPGVYRVEARRPNGGETIARSNPMEIIAKDDSRDRIFWGEIHSHSEMSDGSGDYVELYRHARQDGCLEFAASADHACYFSDNEWQWMQDVCNSWNDPGRFVTLIGYEWAGRQVHRNVYTSRDRLKLFRGMYEPTSNIDAVWEHFHGDEEVVGGPHGCLAHGLVWKHHDPAVERFAEIYSMWGSNDFRENPLVPDFARENPQGMTANELLRSGAKLGFTGGGDCHEGHAGFSAEDPEGQGSTPHTFALNLRYRCGMTAAVVPQLNRRELIAALRNRRTYATTGARILIDFSAADVPMGAIDTAESVECKATVHAEDTIARIEIIKDGSVAWSAQPDSLDAEVAWTDPQPPAGEHYYYLHVVQADGQMAWSSPVWIS